MPLPRDATATTVVTRLLCRHLRVLTRDQAARACDRLGVKGDPASALHRLSRKRLLSSCPTLAIDVAIERPLLRWARGESRDVDIPPVDWLVELRWRHAATSPAVAYAATPALALRAGGVAGRTGKPLQLQHDLLAAEVLIAKLACDQRVLDLWLGEDALHERRPDLGVRPDAALVDPDGSVRLAIEVAGRYFATGRLARFHEACVALNLPYEVW